MAKDNFFSVQPLEAVITNRKVDQSKEKINWLKTPEIKLYKNQPYALHMGTVK